MFPGATAKSIPCHDTTADSSENVTTWNFTPSRFTSDVVGSVFIQETGGRRAHDAVKVSPDHFYDSGVCMSSIGYRCGSALLSATRAGHCTAPSLLLSALSRQGIINFLNLQRRLSYSSLAPCL